MKLIATILAASLILSASFPALTAAPSAAEPEALGTLRTVYEAVLAPIRQKLDDAIKARAQAYVSSLDAVAQQTTSAGKLDALTPLKAERDAYSEGRGTSGFPADNKKIPAPARELRRAYDRDVAKLVGDAAASARPVALNYAKQLGELEAKLAGARNADGVLAVRNEKKAITDAAANPFYGGDAAIVGTWNEPDGGWITFASDGAVRDATGATGKWDWDSRSKGKIILTWINARGKVPYTLTPDGGGLEGRDSKGVHKSLDRSKTLKK